MPLTTLLISQSEVSRLCGYSVNPVFVGGTYRPLGSDIRAQKSHLQAIISAHLLVALATFITTFLPIARFVFRRSHGNWGLGLQLLAWLVCSLGVVGLVLGCWRLFLRWQRRRLSCLFQLLAAVDRFNQLLQLLVARLTERSEQTDVLVLMPVLERVRTHLLLGLQIDRLRRTERDPSILLANLAGNWAQIENLDLTTIAPDDLEPVEQAVGILVTVNRCLNDRYPATQSLPI